MGETTTIHQVAVVEDDDVLRARLVQAVDAHPALDVVADFAGVRTCLDWLSEHSPDVLLVDLNLPDGQGTEVIAQAARRRIESVVITVFADERSVTAAIKAGATGYLLKDSDTERVAESVLLAVEGQSPINPAIARHLLKYFSGTPAAPQTDVDPGPLTEREQAVLTLIARGFSYGETADQLHMSINTVRTHVRHIYRKLEAGSRGEAVYIASNKGWIDP